MSLAPLTFYEFFAGGGMARIGLGERWSCLFANDHDRVKTSAYEANFGDGDLNRKDVFDLNAVDLPGVADLAWASSPCQDLSLAGGRAGLSGCRSSAFHGFWRLIEALNMEGRAPRLVVIENVTGLLTSHGGQDFASICRALANQGYRFGAVEIDAAAFLPQSRRRVLIIGSKCPATLPPDGVETLSIRRARQFLPNDLKRLWISWPYAPRGGRNRDLASLLEPDDAVRWRSADQTLRLVSLMDARHRDRLNAALTSGERRVGAAFRRVRGGVQRAEVRFDGLAGCLRTPGGGSSRQILIVTEGGLCRSRLITPRESARLMGLPESYRLPTCVTDALQVTGDGVAAPVVRWLAEQVLEPLLEADCTETISYNGASKTRLSA